MADLGAFIDQPLIDPALHRLGHDASAIPIDPALFELEGLLNDVRRGKIRLDDTADDQDVGGIGDDEIDPALRAIVNSLTNAQQSSTSSPGPSLTQAQAVAAVTAHIAEHEEPDRLQQSLEEITQASFGALFPPTFPTSPSPFAISQPTELPSTSADLTTDNPPAESSTAPRGRGRPKGSKNKTKANPIPKPPKPKPPPKKRGRPKKIKTEEDIAAEKEAKAAKRLAKMGKKGRPRKFPGFLVREMRLKRHRTEYREIIRRAEEGLPFDDVVLNRDAPAVPAAPGEGYEEMEGVEYAEGDGQGEEGVEVNGGEDNLYHWQADDRALLEVVGAAQQMEDVEGQEQSEQSMREVFGLDVADVPDEGHNEA